MRKKGRSDIFVDSIFITRGAKEWVKSVIPSMIIRYRGRNKGNRVALTFDDGPKPGTTDRVLSILHDKGVNATFFVLGKMVRKNPKLCVAIQDSGSEIGNHGYSHARCTELSLNEISKEISETDTLLSGLGVTPFVSYRPPDGALSSALFANLLFSRRMAPVLWSIAIENEWKKQKKDLVEEVQSMKIIPGDIILLHDVNEETVLALPQIIDHISTLGLLCTSVKEMLSEEV